LVSAATSKNPAREKEAMKVFYSDALVFCGATGDLAYKKIFQVLQAIVCLVSRCGHPAILKLIIPLSVSVLFASMSAAQSATPVVIVDDFLKAWNSHDANTFDRLFMQNAIWVPVAQTRVVGHADVIKEFEQIHTAWAKKTTIIARDIKIQSVRPDVAVILFHAKFVQDAKEVSLLDRALIMVAVKQADGWRIATGQLTKQHEGP
jgi:uncharacterized protein (TIGR02246 family)